MRHLHPRQVYFALSMLVMMIVGGALPYATQAHQDQKQGGSVGGWVRDLATGLGVQATVQVGEHVVSTNEDGTIPSTTIPFASPRLMVDVIVEASGYPTWRYNDVELSQAHPIELHVELGAPAMPPVPFLAATVAASALDRPPDFINIGRTFNATCVYPPTNVQRIDRVPFMVYVRNVLPYEWIPSWPAASLDAGAVAAGQFAWSTALIQRKWSRHGYAFDVLDSACDQVYKDRAPTQSFPATDAAVARMWGMILLRNDKLITTYFRDTDTRCATSGTSDCMGQYGSRDRANEGMTALEILRHYYDPITPTLRLPMDRAVVWERSPDPVIQQGTTHTLDVRLLNVGGSVWNRGATELRVIDPIAPSNTAYRSPFIHSTWIDAHRPAQMNVASAALGQDATWRLTIMVPSGIAPGTYKLVLRWQHRDGTVIPIEPTLMWNVTVTPSFTQAIWVPVVR